MTQSTLRGLRRLPRAAITTNRYGNAIAAQAGVKVSVTLPSPSR